MHRWSISASTAPTTWSMLDLDAAQDEQSCPSFRAFSWSSSQKKPRSTTMAATRQANSSCLRLRLAVVRSHALAFAKARHEHLSHCQAHTGPATTFRTRATVGLTVACCFLSSCSDAAVGATVFGTVPNGVRHTHRVTRISPLEFVGSIIPVHTCLDQRSTSCNWLAWFQSAVMRSLPTGGLPVLKHIPIGGLSK